jgi:hypothetical protein
MNQDRGLVTITLGGIDLDLRFRARALQVIKQLTGKSPPEYMSQLDGLSVDDRSMINAMADMDFVVTLLCAGLSNHPKLGRLKPHVLNDRILQLLEDESDKSDVPLWILPGKVLGEILPAVLAGMGLSAPAGEQRADNGGPKKDEATLVAEETDGTGES